MVGLGDGVAVVVVLRLLLRLAADDVAHGVDAHLPAEALRALLDVGDVAAAVLDVGEGGEQEVAVLRREIAPGRAEGGVHGDGTRHLDAGRAADHALEVVVLALEVERLVGGVAALDDVDPLGRLDVALLAERHAEHRELLRVPAADDVQSRPSLGDVVDGGQGLGGVERMHDRHVHRHEQADPLGGAGEPGRPRKGLEGPFPHAVLAAEALPAGDGEEELDAGPVGDAGRVEIVVPPGAPALRHVGDGEAAIGVRGEDPQLEAVRPLQGMRLDDHGLSSARAAVLEDGGGDPSSLSSSALRTVKNACSAAAMKVDMRSAAATGSRRTKAS